MAKGFNHATQLAISSAASTGRLLGLSAGEIANAIAIATVDNVSLACVMLNLCRSGRAFHRG
jgi:2-methylcitrate dehydratase